MQKLTPLQERFAQEYLVDLNATAAALRAGYSRGDYGRKLTQMPQVRSAIQKIKSKRAEKVEVTAQYVVTELVKLYDKAREDNDNATAIRCLDLLGRHAGIFERDNAQKGAKMLFIQNFKYDERVKEVEPGVAVYDLPAPYPEEKEADS